MEQKRKGFIPVMLTPFTDNGAIDYKALTKLTEVYLQAGAVGLFANCLSSEMFELSDAEKLEVIQHVVKVADGKVPVVATGTFGGAIEKQADFVKKVYDQGADAVIVLASCIAEEAESNEVFDEQIFKLFDLTEKIPLGFYECPVPYKRLISPEQLTAFIKTGKVIYHKDTCLNINQIKEKLMAGVYNPEFGLYDAYMVHAVDSLKAGSAGLSCIQGNFFPELIVWLCDNYANESLKTEIENAQQFLIDNMDVMHNVYPIIAKYWLQKSGLNISTFTRRTVGDFSSTIKGQVESLFGNYHVLQSDLGLKLQL